jgi:hypothetical protein
MGRLGPYRVLKVLGGGGMGVVFQAQDPRLQRFVALKVMKPTLAASDAARERFLREARAAAAIEHQNIVTIYQVDEDRGVAYLAMQLLNGETLEDRLQRQKTLPIQDVLRVGREVAEGLAAAHARGLMHRDIKPANIWLESESGRVKILDFGLARACGEVHVTQQGAIVGTPAYMAPEQVEGRSCDQRCDLFSLGCVLYRACTGVPPFHGEDVIATLMAVATHVPRPPHELRPEVPETLSALVMRLLAKDPAQRPPTARAVVEGLQAIEAARPVAAIAPAALTAAPVAKGVAPPSTPAPQARLLANLAAAAFILALCLCSLAAVRTATGTGRVVVESEDPAATLMLIGRDGQSITFAASPGDTELPLGSYMLKLAEPRKGVRIAPEKVTITRGAREVVQIYRDDDPARP